MKKPRGLRRGTKHVENMLKELCIKEQCTYIELKENHNFYGKMLYVLNRIIDDMQQ